MLDLIQQKLGGLVKSTWQTEIREWGDLVRLYREYADGDHRSQLTREMRQMLRVGDTRTDHFNANYCELIVNKLADRLKVARIECDQDSATAWTEALLEANRFDELQLDIHAAAVRDGDTFLMAAFDNLEKRVVLAHELAWDGDYGMIPVYDRMRKNLIAAIKVWYEGDDRWLNFYYAGRVEKYRYDAGGKDERGQDRPPSLVEREAAASWITPTGEAVGVPIVHFRNRKRSYSVFGKSELHAAIPLQDAMNRTLASMVMTCELTAFGIRKAKGFEPPQNLAPGMWIVFGDQHEDPAMVAVMDAGMMEQGEVIPFISQANFIIDQMGTTTGTPLPGQLGGDTQSGEALKQREVDLIGKAETFQVKNGNVWEDAIRLALRIHAAYAGQQPPEANRISCKWRPVSLRNDTEVVQNALAIRDQVSEAEFLRLVSDVFAWDEKKVDAIIREKEEQNVRRVESFFGRGASPFAAAAAVPQNPPPNGQPQNPPQNPPPNTQPEQLHQSA